MGADEILKDGKYHYWLNDDDEITSKVYFEVVELSEHDKLYSLIKII